MLNVIVTYMLAMKLESIRSKVVKILFDTRGNVSLERLTGEVNDASSVKEMCLIWIVVSNSVDMIKDGADPIEQPAVRKMLNELEAIKIELIRQEADLKLLELVQYFNKGIQAFKNNPLSMDGIKYSLEIEDQRPFRKKELDGLRKLSEKMKGVNCLL